MRQSDGDRRVETDWFPLRPHPCSRRSIISNSRYQLFYRLRQREERESWKILEEHEVEEVYSFFSHKLPHDDPLDLRILQKLLSFELNERPTFEELRKRLYMSSQRDPSVQPVTKLEFEFERLKITKEAMPELIYSILRLLLSTTQRC
ncbi:unnamed protein product [Brassica napus]|uniref:(rape) hypothetical protein n=1 Tax=Brassica napus TaxID=3708 RepID=A0A817AHP0_BRANA|nr:unnamed protein product [Brassica napus]